MAIIVFDDPKTWEAGLTAALGENLVDRIAALKAHHRYVEDSRDTLLAGNKDKILIAALAWVKGNSVAAYHGTRVTPDELRSITEHGLRVLVPEARETRLERALSAHPDWESVALRLPCAIERGGASIGIGTRAGQVHLTLSRASLTRHFNHYLTHGSEFDQQIAFQLLGEE